LVWSQNTDTMPSGPGPSGSIEYTPLVVPPAASTPRRLRRVMLQYPIVSDEPPNCAPPSWWKYQRLVPGDTVNEHMSLRLVRLASVEGGPTVGATWVRAITVLLCT